MDGAFFGHGCRNRASEDRHSPKFLSRMGQHRWGPTKLKLHMASVSRPKSLVPSVGSTDGGLETTATIRSQDFPLNEHVCNLHVFGSLAINSQFPLDKGEKIY